MRATTSTDGSWQRRQLGWLLGLTLLLGGCGQYTTYDGSLPGGNTIEGLSEVERLHHHALAGPVQQYVTQTSDGSFVDVDYDAWSEDPEALHLLDDYQATLATVLPTALESRAERLAYWVNGYNAAVIRGVLDHYSGDHGYRVIEGSFFDEARYTFGGVLLSLNHVEQGVIRGDLQDPSVISAGGDIRDMIALWHDDLWDGGVVDARVHAVLNCAAQGCPNLLATAPFVYRADVLEQQLQIATRQWLDHPDKGAGAQGISQLFDWYVDDFTADAGSVEDFIAAHRSDGLQGVDTTQFIPYDWTLNIVGN